MRPFTYATLGMLRIIISTQQRDTIIELVDWDNTRSVLGYLHADDDRPEPIGNPYAHRRPFTSVSITQMLLPSILIRWEYGPVAVRWIMETLQTINEQSNARK